MDRELGALVHRLLFWGVAASGALVAAGLLAARSAVVEAGLVLLMATPVARVAALAWFFGRKGETRFAAISGSVLALLGLGLALGLRR